MSTDQKQKTTVDQAIPDQLATSIMGISASHVQNGVTQTIDAQSILDACMPIEGLPVANAAEHALEAIPPDESDAMISDFQRAANAYSFSAILSAVHKWVLIGEQARLGIMPTERPKPGAAKGLIFFGENFESPTNIGR
ncbi:MAG: hypothetical protein ACLQVD_10035 [Capsulimonadaceae bacterium]